MHLVYIFHSIFLLNTDWSDRLHHGAVGPQLLSQKYLNQSHLQLLICYVWRFTSLNNTAIGRFEVLTTVFLDIGVFWNIASCPSVNSNRRFGRTTFLQRLVTIYWSTRRNDPGEIKFEHPYWSQHAVSKTTYSRTIKFAPL